MSKIKPKEQFTLFDTVFLKRHYKAGEVEYFFIYPVGFTYYNGDGRIFTKDYLTTNLLAASCLPYPEKFTANKILIEFDKFDFSFDLRIYYGANTKIVHTATTNIDIPIYIHWKPLHLFRTDMIFTKDINFPGDSRIKLSLSGTMISKGT